MISKYILNGFTEGIGFEGDCGCLIDELAAGEFVVDKT